MKKTLPRLLALALSSVLALGGLQAPASAAVSCTDPKWSTTDPDGMWFQGRYIVHNNMWNAAGYDVSQRLTACSYRNWRVVATADDRSGDGAVKTYPNVHRDYHDWSTGWEPRVNSFRTIRSGWAARTPGRGIWNAAYDIWLDGVPGRHEVMIWTRNRKQVPAGRKVAGPVTIGDHRWNVWATGDNGYIAFVPVRNHDRGRIRIKSMLTWLMKRGRLDRDVRLGQIGYGFEIVSTGGSRARFKVDNFWIRSQRK